ncbi:hypothetical protein [Chondrinema litorale]|uniref:hypothetical protein n=1 Tax=Chondrinema litorale TaxID=2994555 RepID=UPI002542BE6A|nr:hypothetical protein [Chondrinema litorale]UZS00174.1 hypothetical protein OQ292_40165 [Chondrinema litorale]
MPMYKAKLLLLSTAAFILSRIRVIFNDFVVSNDASQHHFWMFKFDNDYFHEPDIIASFAEIIQPKAYVVFYNLLLKVIDMKYAILIVEYLIFIITAFILIEICKKFFKQSFLIAYLIIIVSLSLPDVVGGFARSFSFLIIILPFYFLDKKFDQIYISIVLFISAFLYPVSFLISTGTIMLVYLFKAIINNKYLYYTKKVSVITLSVLFAVYLLQVKSDKFNTSPYVGKVIEKKDILENPIMSNKGRIPLKPQFKTISLKLMGAEMAKSMSAFLQVPDLFKILNTWLIFILSIIPVLTLCYLTLKNRDIENIHIFLLSIFLSGVILFFLARLIPFKLYMPTRYLEKTFPILFTLICLLLYEKYFNIDKVKYLIGSFYMLLLLAGIFNNNFRGLNNYSEFAKAYELVENTEKKSLIAAPPDVANLLPFFAKRSVLVSEESCHGVYYKNYREDQMQKMHDLIRLYAEDNKSDIKQIITRYNISYIIIDRESKVFSNRSKKPLFAPFQVIVNQLNTKSTFDNSYLYRIASETNKEDRFILIDVNQLNL